MAPTKAVARGLVLALGAAALVWAGGVRAETRVLLVGVGAYAGLSSEYRLAAPAHDLARLSSSLIAAGVPASSIEQVSDARSGQGSRLAILGAIEDLVAKTGAGDRVLLYYSGHGGQRPATYPEREPDGLEEVWLAGDAQIASDGTLRGGFIADHEIVQAVSRMLQRGADVWLVVDACYAGGVTRGSTDAIVKAVGEPAGRRSHRLRSDDAGLIGPDLIAPDQTGEGRFTAFYAAGAGSLALAAPTGSLFTKALARALDSGRVASLRDLVAGTLSLDARLGPDAPRPVFEGDLDRPVLDLVPGSVRRFALRRSGATVTLIAGQEEGIEAGSRVRLEAADGRNLDTVLVARVGLGGAQLSGGVPSEAVAGRLLAADRRRNRPADRLLSAIETLGGSWAPDAVAISARVERPDPGSCLEPVDPQAPGPNAVAFSLLDPPPLRDCDRLYLTLSNQGTQTLDVSLLYLAADGSVVGPGLHPVDDVRLRPGERRVAAIRIVAEPGPVVERLAVLAMPATSRFPLDLRYLASASLRGGEIPTSEGVYAQWWASQLEGEATRVGQVQTPPPGPVAIAFPMLVVP